MMERMTFDGNFCDIAQCAEIQGGSFCEDGSCNQKKTWERLKAYEDTGLTPGEVRSLWEVRNAIVAELNSIGNYDRLCELVEADKDGRLVVLPCKVGDTVFLTRKEAEAALKEAKDVRTTCIQAIAGHSKGVFQKLKWIGLHTQQQPNPPSMPWRLCGAGTASTITTMGKHQS